MKKRLAGVICASLLLAIAAGSAVAVSLAQPTDLSALADRAKSLSGRADVDLELLPITQPGDSIDTLRDVASGAYFDVEKSTGDIVYYSNSSAWKAARSKPVEERAVVEAAEAYAKEVYSNARLATMKRTVALVDRGEERHYQVNYDEWIGEARTFNRLYLTYTEDGQLLTCSLLDRDVVVSVIPKLDRSAAINVASAYLDVSKWASEDIELMVYRIPDDSQRLCWSVTLNTGDDSFGAHFHCLVDASDGKIVNPAVASR